MKNLGSVAAMTLALGLAGCGGGGGSDSNTTATTYTDVTASVQPAVTYSGSTTPVSLSSTTTADLAAQEALKPAFSKIFGYKVLATATGDLIDAYNTASTMISIAGVPSANNYNVSFYCGAGDGSEGSVTGTATFASSSQVSAGDHFDFTFNNCVVGNGNYWNGEIIVSINSVTGDPTNTSSNWTTDTGIAFVNLQIFDSGMNPVVDLDGRIGEVATNTVNSNSTRTETTHKTGTHLYYYDHSASEEFLVENFDATATYTYDTTNQSLISQVLSPNYTFSSSGLSGSANIKTTAPLHIPGIAKPDQGIVQILDDTNMGIKLQIPSTSTGYDLDAYYGDPTTWSTAYPKVWADVGL